MNSESTGKTIASVGWGVKILGGTGFLILATIVLLPFAFAPLIFFWGKQAETELGGSMVYQLGGAVRFSVEINRAAAKYDLDPALLAAIIKQESNFNPKATNRTTGATGLMQLMPFNYKGIDPYDPLQNVYRGAKILRDYLDMFDQDLEKALAAYNAGPANVQKYRGIPPFPETQKYVPAVKNHYKYFQQYAVPVFSGSGKLGNPAPEAVLTSSYGPRNGRIHQGQDFAAPIGTPIRSAESGKVIQIRHLGDRSYGSYVVIDHGNGVTTLYAHMWKNQVKVEKGQKVRRGQQIGSIGNNGNSTGPHLHFEVRVDGHPVDPRPFLKRKD